MGEIEPWSRGQQSWSLGLEFDQADVRCAGCPWDPRLGSGPFYLLIARELLSSENAHRVRGGLSKTFWRCFANIGQS